MITDTNTDVTDKYMEIIWKKTDSIEFSVHDNGITVMEGSHDKIDKSNILLVANVTGISKDEIEYIAEPSVEAAKRKSSNNTMKLGKKL